MVKNGKMNKTLAQELRKIDDGISTAAALYCRPIWSHHRHNVALVALSGMASLGRDKPDYRAAHLQVLQSAFLYAMNHGEGGQFYIRANKLRDTYLALRDS